MKTKIHLINNKTIEVDDKDLREYVRYGQFWLGLIYNNGEEVFIPNVQIGSVSRIK